MLLGSILHENYRYLKLDFAVKCHTDPYLPWNIDSINKLGIVLGFSCPGR